MFIALKGHSFYNIAIFDLQVILLLQCVSTQITEQFGWRSQKLIFKMVTMAAILNFQSVCLFVLRFYGPVNPMGSCRARSVYLTTRLLGRLSPLSS